MVETPIHDENRRVFYAPRIEFVFDPAVVKHTSPAVDDIIRQINNASADDFAAISDLVEEILRRKKGELTSTLRGAAKAHLLTKNTAKFFVLSHWSDATKKPIITEGVDFAAGQSIDDDDEEDMLRVFLLDSNDGIDVSHYTMQTLKKQLSDLNITYAIEYRS